MLFDHHAKKGVRHSPQSSSFLCFCPSYFSLLSFFRFPRCLLFFQSETKCVSFFLCFPRIILISDVHLLSQVNTIVFVASRLVSVCFISLVCVHLLLRFMKHRSVTLTSAASKIEGKGGTTTPLRGVVAMHHDGSTAPKSQKGPASLTREGLEQWHPANLAMLPACS